MKCRILRKLIYSLPLIMASIAFSTVSHGAVFYNCYVDANSNPGFYFENDCVVQVTGETITATPNDSIELVQIWNDFQGDYWINDGGTIVWDNAMISNSGTIPVGRNDTSNQSSTYLSSQSTPPGFLVYEVNFTLHAYTYAAKNVNWDEACASGEIEYLTIVYQSAWSNQLSSSWTTEANIAGQCVVRPAT